jgi:hypothetical protein
VQEPAVHVTVALYSVSCRAKLLYLAVHVTVALYSCHGCLVLMSQLPCTLSAVRQSCCILLCMSRLPCTLSAVGQTRCILKTNIFVVNTFYKFSDCLVCCGAGDQWEASYFHLPVHLGLRVRSHAFRDFHLQTPRTMHSYARFFLSSALNCEAV